MLNSNYLLIALFLEMFAIGNLAVSSSIIAVYLYIFVHFIVSILLSFILLPFFYLKFKEEKINMVIVLTLIIFITFVIGLFFSLGFLFYLFLRKKHESEPIVSLIDIKEYTDNIPKMTRKLGEGALNSFNTNMPTSLKSNILSLIKDNKQKSVGKILKEALSDNEDEIRLLAFSILSKEEDKINKNIFFLKEKLKFAKTDKEKANFYKNIGIFYWEAIFLEVSDEEMQEYYLKLAKENLKKSLTFNEDPEAIFYLARIALKERDFKTAQSLFYKIAKSNYRKKIIPYYMEILFNNKEYKKLIKVIQGLDPLSVHPNFYYIYKIWKRDEG